MRNKDFKITVYGKQIKLLQSSIDKIRRDVPKEMKNKFKAAADIMKDDIEKTILRGNSPVKGYKRFLPYSESYKQQILGEISFRTLRSGKVVPVEPTSRDNAKFADKKIRPVNLKLSGRMLSSLTSRLTSSGFVIYFTNKLAKIHSTEGPSGKKSAIRKVAPYGQEEWKRSVTNNMRTFLTTKTVKLIVNKFLRIK